MLNFAIPYFDVVQCSRIRETELMQFQSLATFSVDSVVVRLDLKVSKSGVQTFAVKR